MVLITQMEHHSNIVPWQLLCQEVGAELRWLDVSDDGRLSLDQLDEELASGRVKLAAFAHISNVLGTINPVSEIAARVRAAGAVSLVDGSQGIPQLPVDVGALGIDFYAWTGHKALGPTGIGVLHGRREILEAMRPFLGGGDMIRTVELDHSTWNDLPWKFEAGTSMVAEGVGLGAAVDYLSALGMENVRAHEHALVEYALGRLGEVGGVRDRRPGRRRRPRRRDLLRARRRAPARRGRADQPRERLRPRRPPLRDAADAPPRRAGHRPRLVRRPTTTRATSTR